MPPEGSPHSTTARKKRGALARVLFAPVAIILVLALIEGLASLGLLARDLTRSTRSAVAERQHTQYDEEIGWVNVPDRVVENMYGEGSSVTINGQGFRGLEDYAEAVPAGRRRILCSGDSFTLGYGVGDRETWCHVLEELVPDFQIVNMGQGGYGFDQSYLWYERDGRSLEHDLHLVCLNLWQVLRMRVDTFLGYAKPVLGLENGELRVVNAPLPMRASYTPFLTRSARTLRELRTVQWFTEPQPNDGVAVPGAEEPKETVLSTEDCLRFILHGLEGCAARDQAHGSRTVVVWLPLLEEHQPGPNDRMRNQMLRTIQSKNIPVLDLTAPLRQLSAEQVHGLFLHEGDLEFQYAEGHYDVQGNRWLAERLAEWIRRQNWP